MLEDKFNQIESEILESKELELITFDVNLLENQQGKYTNLINNQLDDFIYEFKNKIYIFNFIEPIFVNSIRLVSSDGISLKDIEIIPIDYEKKENYPIKFDKNHTTYISNKVLFGFKIKALNVQ